MVNTSKILTVSYGTFSCTLEGFDDSFDTMKAIAEYFRDLASDDRYFGAEPPVPDTEMLARIAEREISRRVEAVETQGSVVLRAHSEAPQSLIADGETEGASESATQDPIHVTAPQKAAATTQEDTSHLLAEDQPVAEEIPAQALSVEDTPIAAPVVTPVTPEMVTPAITGITDEVFEEEILEDETIEDAFEDMTSASLPEADSESVAAKLQRIRAVVSKSGDVTADDKYNEDEHAVDFLDDAVSEIGTALDVDDQTETQVQDDSTETSLTEALSESETDHDGDDFSGLIERLEQDNQVDQDATAQDAPLETLVDISFEDTIAASLEEILEDDSYEFAEQAISADITEDITEGTIEDVAEILEETTQPVAPVAAPVRARVLKVKRADFEAAIGQGQIVEEEAAETAATASDDISTLSSEDEAELLNELAIVEAEMGEVATKENIDEAIEDNTDDTLTLERAELTENNEQDLSRILAKTKSQMDEPTGKTRRSAIQHLRAAVAATKAEKAAGNDTTIKPDTSGAYRDDLASVVRPRRPISNDRARVASRPLGLGVAPLKLVAEQRIDGDDTPVRQPVRPRRVSLAELAAQSEASISDDETIIVDAGNFNEFAETMGATKLPDLLEAAAAYLSFVEGREKFSRPQLMTKVRQVEQDDFSREDGLRSFGQLLRQGKIQKLKGGRFTVSERINYKPDERYAG